MNTNCLKGWKCPDCGQSTAFHVVSVHTVILTDEGTEPLNGNEEFGGDSNVLCPVCDWLGIMDEVCL